ncbi:MAG: hypothetical protein ABIO60_12735 [Aquaticitalea sp.]
MKPIVLTLIMIILSSCNNSKGGSLDADVLHNENIVSEGIAVIVQKTNSTKFQKQIISNGIIEAAQKR